PDRHHDGPVRGPDTAPAREPMQRDAPRLERASSRYEVRVLRLQPAPRLFGQDMRPLEQQRLVAKRHDLRLAELRRIRTQLRHFALREPCDSLDGPAVAARAKHDGGRGHALLYA